DDGRHVVFLVRSASPIRQGAWLMSIDSPGDRVRLVGTDAQALPVDGRLVYASDTAMVSQRIDLDERRMTGDVTVLGIGAGRGPDGQLLATASPDVLIFGPPSANVRELAWFTRSGEREETIATGSFGAVRIAPEGRRVAVTALQPQLRTLDIVILEPPRPVPSALSRSTESDYYPAWSPVGLRVAWTSARRRVLVRGAGAMLDDDTIATFDEPVRVSGWTPDGTAVIVSRTMSATREDVWMVPIRLR